MTADARISTGLPGHPKTKKLIKRTGEAGAWNLVCLFLWVASNRSDGDLSGMTEEDIELAAGWSGKDGDFVKALIAVGFIEGEQDDFRVHDWAEHNPWAAGAESRSVKARWNAAKRHHGEAEADRLVPEFRASRSASSNAGSNASSTDLLNGGNAPSPSPSPSPSPKARAKEKSLGQQAARFDEFWAAYPNRKGKAEALKKWRALSLDAIADRIIADVKARIACDREWISGYVPHGSTYVNGRGWEDEIAAGRNPRGIAAEGVFGVAL